jgi:hypothetical protein
MITDMSGPHRDDQLPRLYEEHMRAPFPAGFRGVDIEGVELILLDADVAGVVRGELKGGSMVRTSRSSGRASRASTRSCP